MKQLEKSDIARQSAAKEEHSSPVAEPAYSPAERILLDTDMNNLTPMQAFNLLSDLVDMVKKD